MRALVTGATGKVGHATVRALLAAGHEVRALVRDPGRARPVVPGGAELVRGDVTDESSLAAAAAGCEVVFSAHGLPEQWLADEREFERVNVQGAAAVVRAGAAAGARRVVHTSTIDVFDAEPDGRLHEGRLATRPKGTAYERSKQRAEAAVAEAAAGRVELVMVNPAAVYGPGPRGGASLEAAVFEPVIRGSRLRAPFLPPGGMGLVFSDGVGAGQLLAAERGVPGERYILCDGHATLRELAELVRLAAGRGRVPPVMPRGVARAVSAGGEAAARLIRRPPLLPKGQLHFLLWNARPDASRAQRELGWTPTPLEQGVRRAVATLAG
jgi:nucleoside-diphosphate-sugar epimerase